MDSQQFQKAKALFLDLADLPPERRQAELILACGDDQELRREVESLFAVHDSGSASFSTGGAVRGLAIAGFDPQGWLGRRLGPWEVDGVLGRGGMGTVFAARRIDGGFEQRVAIKVLSRQLVDREGRDRFERERRLLARLEHPNIAHLVDGGTTDDGVPYLVMEYVEGSPIDRWCDERQLGLASRLDLFRAVAAAVQHAHSRLILHRDIKPSNVMVTTDGHVKLLDFGVARALETPDDEGVTQEGLAPLTPEYAAPEQFTGADLSAATDVYQLGVLLYRLMTGRVPFEHDTRRFGLLVREVMDRMPPPPSDSGSAPLDGAGRVLVTREELAGDLDDIVMMAIRKEPERRYQSAADLAEDLRCYLAGRPVSAHGGSRGYRIRKFVRRNRAAVVAAAVAGVAVVAGVGATWRQAQVARAEAEKAQAINGFLREMLGSSDPFRLGLNVTVREVLDRAGPALDTAFAAQPDIRAGLWSTIGVAYAKVGAGLTAGRYLDSAVATYDRLGRIPSRESYDAIANRIAALYGSLRYEEARNAAEAVLPAFRDRFGDRDTMTIGLRGIRAMASAPLGELDRSVATIDTLLPLLREVAGPASRSVATLEMAQAGLMTLQARRAPEVGRLVDHALGVADSLGVAADLITLKSMAVEILARQGRTEDAARIATEVIREADSIYQGNPGVTIGPRRMLALAMLESRRLDSATVLMRGVVADANRFLPVDSDNRIFLLQDYATVLTYTGQFAEAERRLREAYDFFNARDDSASVRPLLAYQNLAMAIRAQGRQDEALEMLTGLLPRYRAIGNQGNDYYFAVINVASVLREVRGPGASLALLDEHLAGARERLAASSRPFNLLLWNRGLALSALRRFDDAEAMFVEVRDNYLAARSGDRSHPDVQWATQQLAGFYEAAGRADAAARIRAEGQPPARQGADSGSP
ncbi:MAG: protein kinase [Gemmatimonadales bacterium]